MTLRRSLTRVLGLAVLLAGGLLLPARSAYAADHVDGYVRWDGPCMVLAQHDGSPLWLSGDTIGLRGGDHVRLEGVIEPANRRCGAGAFHVSLIQTLWADDYHRSTIFDHLNGVPFERWAERNGRYGVERRAETYGSRSYGYGYRSNGYQPPTTSGYVYRGSYRRMTLVGRLDMSQSGCPMVVTEYGDFAVDGDLGVYQHGDRVRVDGFFYERDPNAPCGATLVIHGIRGR